VVSVCDDSSSLFGGSSFIGFNHVTDGGLVIGFEVEGALLDGTGRDDCTLIDTTGPIPRNVEVDLNWETSGRLRAGMLPADNIMVYAIGGISAVDGDVTIRDPGDPTPIGGSSELFYGGVVGVGLEAQVSPALTLRAEATHAFYPEISNPPIGGLPSGISASDFDLSTTSATLSLLLRF
jgi:opacity protein-like surface antigen